MINYAGAYIYIDALGNILELNDEKLDLPILIGITTDFAGLSIGKQQSQLNEKDLEKMIIVNSIMDSARSNDVADLITSIDISNNKNYTLQLESEGKTVYLGDCSDLNTRILYMKEILNKEKNNNGEIFINMNLDLEYVYFKESV